MKKNIIISLLYYFKILIIITIFSYIIGSGLLFIYTTAYNAPFPDNINLITDFAKFFLLLFGIGFMFFMGPEELFKFVLGLIVFVTFIIMFLGLFPRNNSSPQRYLLKMYKMGGTNVSYKLKNKCGMGSYLNNQFLIYKGNKMYYFKFGNKAEGINKECIVTQK